MGAQREAEFAVQNSRDGLRVVVNDEFFLVKFEHERDFVLDQNEARTLAKFILNVREVGNGVFQR